MKGGILSSSSLIMVLGARTDMLLLLGTKKVAPQCFKHKKSLEGLNHLADHPEVNKQTSRLPSHCQNKRVLRRRSTNCSRFPGLDGSCTDVKGSRAASASLQVAIENLSTQ